MTTLSHHMRI